MFEDKWNITYMKSDNDRDIYMEHRYEHGHTIGEISL